MDQFLDWMARGKETLPAKDLALFTKFLASYQLRAT